MQQLQQIKKRLQKDEGSGSGAADSSDNDIADDDKDDEEEEIGPNSYISLLDQHSELKKKAEGISRCVPACSLMMCVCVSLKKKIQGIFPCVPACLCI